MVDPGVFRSDPERTPLELPALWFTGPSGLTGRSLSDPRSLMSDTWFAGRTGLLIDAWWNCTPLNAEDAVPARLG
jgi:hypothetical protein